MAPKKKGEKTPLEPKEIKAAKAVRDSVSLRNVHFMHTSTFVGPFADDIYTLVEQGEIETRIEYQVSARLFTDKPHRAGDSFIVGCDMGIREVIDDPESDAGSQGQDVVFSVEAKIALNYDVGRKSGLTKRGKEIFARENGPFNAWSFWREFVHNATWRMGIPPVSLPMMIPRI